MRTAEFSVRAPVETLRLQVARRTEPARDVLLLELQAPSGDELPGWEPGAHIDVVLSPTMTRQYSLCGDPRQRSNWRIAVLNQRAGRGGSATIHNRLGVGATVEVRGPRNHFGLDPASDYLFIAGGIGITPILPMVRQVAADGARWRLLYGGRSRDSMAFASELEQLGDGVTLWPQDELGLLDLDAELGTPRPDTLVYCCGPEPLLAAVQQRCAAWPAGALRVERFSPPTPDPPQHTASFEIELARSAITAAVPPNRSILEVVEAAGIAVRYSCREGICGTCETTILAGAADHRDAILTPTERRQNASLMICVSRAACPRLVLDL